MNLIDMNDLVLEEMSQGAHKNKVFQLLWVQYFLPSEGRFYVQFKPLDKNARVLPIKLKPEQLNLYTPGGYYCNGLLLSDPPPVGHNEILDVVSQNRNEHGLVKDLVPADLYDLSSPFPRNFSLEQKCIVINDDSRQYIFPCFLLGATYYFRSASMRQHLLTNNLKALYETSRTNEIKIENGHAQIHLTHFAKDNDVADILRFATNPLAHRHWEEVTNAMRLATINNKDPDRISLFADFPVSQRISIKARMVKTTDPATGKEKILVLDILEEDSAFAFDRVTIFRQGSERKEFSLKKRVKSYRTVRTLSKTASANNLASVQILNAALAGNPHKAQMIIQKEILSSPEHTGDKAFPLISQGEDGVTISLEDSERESAERVRHGEVVPEEPSAEPTQEKKSTTFRDFNALLESLREDVRIANFFWRGEAPILPRAKVNARGSLREYYDKKRQKTRRYSAASFFYKETSVSVCLIEIDQAGLQTGFSTCVLISPKKHFNWTSHIQDYLNWFVDNERFIDIESHFKAKHVCYFGKKHPPIETTPIPSPEQVKEVAMAWKDTLLKMISTKPATPEIVPVE